MGGALILEENVPGSFTASSVPSLQSPVPYSSVCIQNTSTLQQGKNRFPKYTYSVQSTLCTPVQQSTHYASGFHRLKCVQIGHTLTC